MQTISQFSSNFNGISQFPLHFGLQNTSQNHLKIDSGRFWRQSGIDLVLQGRIWMDSERLGLDFSLIWARFCLYFRVDRAWLLQTIARWTICISCCTQHGIVAFTLHFLADTWNSSHPYAHRTSAAPNGVHGVLNSLTNSANKVYYISTLHSFNVWIRLFLMKPSSKLCLPGPHGPPNGPKIEILFSKIAFLAVQKKASKFEWKKCKKSEKITNFEVPRPSKNPPKIGLTSKSPKTCKFIIFFDIFY